MKHTHITTTHHRIPHALTATAVATMLSLSSLASTAAEANWPGWRGPNGNSIVTEVPFNPDTLTPTPDIRWKTEVGKGHSSISVVGPYIYTMGNIDDRDIVYCLREDNGQEVWRHTYACKGGNYSGPRSTPLIADGRVYTLSRDGHCFCLDAKTGQVIWQKNVQKAYGAKPPTWGFASSPVIYKGVLLLNVATHGIALNARTGDTFWKSSAGVSGYSTPVVATINSVKTVVLFGKDHLYGVDLQTGKQRFSHPWQTKHNINAADPVVIGHYVFISSGYDRGCALLDVSKPTPRVVWEHKNMRNHFSPSVLLDGYLYGVDGNTPRGELACMNMRTGKIAWREETRFGSLMAVDKTLIFFNERGTLFAIKATPKAYTEMARVDDLLPRICWTPPTLCGKVLYLRNSNGRILSLDVR